MTAGAVALGPAGWERVFAAPAVPGPSPYGPLQPPDANGIKMPAGFRSRVIARSGLPVGAIPFLWPIWPDGAHSSATSDGGWILAVNSEAPVGTDLPFPPPPLQQLGGVAAIRFSATGKIVDAYSICSGTRTNCSGGHTPWGTWLTCEEFDESIRDGPTANAGRVWECDPTGAQPAKVRPTLGSFKHEACAVEPANGRVYLTEDVPDGRFYRFTPAEFTGGPSDLNAGTLEAARLIGPANGPWSVTWHTIADPTAQNVSTRNQAPATTPFNGGEGCWFDSGIVYFTTKGDNRVWRHHIATQTVDILYDAADPANQAKPILRGVDDVLVSRSGDIFVAEDGDNMQIVLITPNNSVHTIIRATGFQHGFLENPLPSPLGSIPLKSEVTGLAFSPDGKRLYFSSQRGFAVGITYEVRGPFRATA